MMSFMKILKIVIFLKFLIKLIRELRKKKKNFVMKGFLCIRLKGKEVFLECCNKDENIFKKIVYFE